MAYMQRGYLTKVLNNEDNVYMLGPVTGFVALNSLPTNQDVLKYFFSLVKGGDLPLDSARIVALGVQERWNDEGIPSQPCSSISVLVLSLIKNWDEVQKRRNQHSEEQRLRRDQFRTKLGEIFDVLEETDDAAESQHQNRWCLPAPRLITNNDDDYDTSDASVSSYETSSDSDYYSSELSDSAHDSASDEEDHQEASS